MILRIRLQRVGQVEARRSMYSAVLGLQPASIIAELSWATMLAK
jgi:hypothetical protein